MPIRVSAVLRRAFLRPALRAARPPAGQARLSVTRLEGRDVPAAIPIGGGGRLPEVSINRLADAYEGGSAGAFRLYRTGDASQARLRTRSPNLYRRPPRRRMRMRSGG
ncbi:MAG: hypothetical protein K2X82_26145 [Gemmataceae bacterium]|nr:hypothetical protein [Gemmataceae bacterium]